MKYLHQEKRKSLSKRVLLLIKMQLTPLPSKLRPFHKSRNIERELYIIYTATAFNEMPFLYYGALFLHGSINSISLRHVQFHILNSTPLGAINLSTSLVFKHEKHITFTYVLILSSSLRPLVLTTLLYINTTFKMSQ